MNIRIKWLSICLWREGINQSSRPATQWYLVTGSVQNHQAPKTGRLWIGHRTHWNGHVPMVWHNRSWSVYGHWASLVLRVCQETIGIGKPMIPSWSIYCPYYVILYIYIYIYIHNCHFDVHQGSRLSTIVFHVEGHRCLANISRLIICYWDAFVEHIMYRTMYVYSIL